MIFYIMIYVIVNIIPMYALNNLFNFIRKVENPDSCFRASKKTRTLLISQSELSSCDKQNC